MVNVCQTHPPNLHHCVSNGSMRAQKPPTQQVLTRKSNIQRKTRT